MNFKKTKLTLTLALLTQLPLTAFSQNSYYEAGQKALHNQQYHQALLQFKKAQQDTEYADAALYWQAYVLFKDKQNATAKRTLQKLMDNYPQSKWLDDAEILALEYELNQNPVDINTYEDKLEELKLNEELRLYAVQQLMIHNPERGIPLVKDLIENSTELRVKLNAMKFLSFSDLEGVSQYLYGIASLKPPKQPKKPPTPESANKPKPPQTPNQALRSQAIRLLSLTDNKESQKLLMKLYKQNQDKELKLEIIQNFRHNDDPRQIMELLSREKDSELNQQLIQTLGIIGASKELRSLAHRPDIENISALIHALALSGDSQTLKDMIKTHDNLSTKLDAIRSFVILDNSNNNKDYLINLYRQTKNKEIKHELIRTFMATNIGQDNLIKLIKSETNNKLKSSLINSMMASGYKQGLLSLLKTETSNETQKEIIIQLGIMGANKELIKTFRNSSEKSRKIKVIEAMGLNDSSTIRKFLIQAYQQHDKEIKSAVIQSFMVQDNARPLIKLLKQETDIDLKKQLIQVISMIDADYLLDRISGKTTGEQK